MPSKHTSHTSKKPLIAWDMFKGFNVQSAALSLIVLMIILVPLISGTDYLRNYGKPLVFEVLGCILLAVVASQITITKNAIRSLQSRLKVGPTIPIIGLFIYGVATYFLQHLPARFDLTARAELFRLFFCSLIYIVVALYLQGVQRLQVIVDVLVGVGAVVAIISLASVGVSGGEIMIHGTFGTHETLGSFLLFVLPIALPVSLIDLGQPKRQIFALVVTLFVAAALLMAHTRSAWLGSSVSLFVLAILYWRFQTNRKSAMTSTEKAAVMIGSPLIMAAAVALFLLTSEQTPTIVSRAATITNLNADDSAHVRHRMFEGALHMIRLKPVFGWGPGIYPLLSEPYTGVGRTVDDVLSKGDTLDNNAHSFYMQFTADYGVVGLAIFCTIVIMFLYSTITSLKTMPVGLRKCVTIGCIAASIGQLVDASISPSYNLPAISMFQYLVFGLGILAARGLDLPVTVPAQPALVRTRVRKRVSRSDDEGLIRAGD